MKESAEIPNHIAIVMDGNGRWARQRGLPRVEGHRNGVESVRAVVRAAGELGIKYLTLYAFSVENWNRPKDEVDMLLARKETQPLDEIGAVLRVEDICAVQELVRKVKVEQSLCDYTVDLVSATRKSDQLALGASPRRFSGSET